jgi:WD40 repeat protein
MGFTPLFAYGEWSPHLPCSIVAHQLSDVGDLESRVCGFHCLHNHDPPLKKCFTCVLQVCALSYCPLARCVMAESWGGRMCIYRDVGPDDPARVLRRMDGHTQDITCLAFSVKLGLIATACAAGGVRVWDLDDAKLVCLYIPHNTSV